MRCCITITLQELQRKSEKGGVAPRGQQAVLGKLSPRGNAALNVNRSKSVQQARGPASAGPVKRGSADDNDSLMKRPSSMHTITNRDVKAVAAAAGPPIQKGKRAAFGSASEKPPAYIKREEPPKKPESKKKLNKLESAFPNKSNIPVPTRYTDKKEPSQAGRAPQSTGAAVAMSGFARLQLGVKGGPVVVNHGDEDDYGGGRGGGGRGGGRDSYGGSGGGELKGRSEYIRMDDDDGVNGDQLDRLLNKAKRTYAG